MFYNPVVMRFYEKVMGMKFEKEIALLLGCSMHKPYSQSFMHKKVIAMLKKNGFDDIVQQYIIGEPMVVVPREMENEYPAADYEFNPEALGEEGRKIFIERLRKFFEKVVNMHKAFVVFAPNHHKEIIMVACNGILIPKVVPYNVYNLRKLLETIMECANEIQGER